MRKNLNRSIERQTTQDQVYYTLRQALKSGELNQGQRIQEEQLAQQFKVSRTPLRGALSKLVQDGLLVSIPFKGVFVREYTLSEIQQLYELRGVLEAFAVRAACRRASEDELEEIVAHLDETERAMEKGKGLSTLLDANTKFHIAIALAGKNEWVCDALEGLHAHFGLLRSANLQHEDRKRQVVREHKALVEALLARNEELAAEIAQAHMRHAWQFTRDASAEPEAELQWEMITMDGQEHDGR